MMANNGQKMKLLVYRNSHDVDVEFEDGTIEWVNELKNAGIKFCIVSKNSLIFPCLILPQ